MSNTGILMIVVLGLSLVVLMVLMVIIFKIKDAKQSKEEKKAYVLTIEDYAKIASDRNSTKNELASAALEVIRSFPFPPKKGENTPKEAKPYLDFVFFVVYHKRSDAKLIAHLSQELKKKNPAYVQEIDAYEEEGMKKRRFQPQK